MHDLALAAPEALERVLSGLSAPEALKRVLSGSATAEASSHFDANSKSAELAFKTGGEPSGLGRELHGMPQTLDRVSEKPSRDRRFSRQQPNRRCSSACVQLGFKLSTLWGEPAHPVENLKNP